MPRKTLDGIPQIVAIVSLTAKKQINLKKAARQHLNLEAGQPLWFTEGHEVLLTTTPPAGGTAAVEVMVSKGNRVTLPDSTLDRLGIQAKSVVGLVQRPDALAIKKLAIIEREAAQARPYDCETSTAITRCVETNPMPEERIPALCAKP